ncbi:magnesium and cobalt transport protein CorA [Yinghuangia soli]|uniref:Magnesium and cobalt transport protein CorA n=1 Tax=Yinghuangia soli TaxID=2908204 RepID=A0AA41U582_9ACTN|nr:magnesium and cobalt transport protein CorA [Yinghuangia soli]MCF2533761.1 magnesium and cobalt transport protein CorA [Yinghuangia soli]
MGIANTPGRRRHVARKARTAAVDLDAMRRNRAGTPVVDCALYEDGVRRPGSLDLHQAMDAARACPGSFVWIGLHAPTQADFTEIAATLDLHPLAVEDAVHAHQRPKLERYEDTLFLVLKTIVYVEHDELTATSDVVDTGEIMVFAGEDFVVHVRHGSAPPLKELRRKLEAAPERLAQGPAAVLHAIADRTVDDYLRVTDKIADDFEQLESDVFSPHAGTNDAERIYQLKRELTEFKRAVMPLAIPLERLAGLELPGAKDGMSAYFRDIADHLAQTRERLSGFNELLDSILTASLARVGIQQNTDMRRIASIAALLAVPTMFVGVYGMNFDHMPELRWTYGYPAVLAAMATACGLLFRAFRRNGWL